MFCNNDITNYLNFSKIEIVENYKYLLMKIFYEIKNLIKKHLELSKKFYFTNNTLLKNKLKVIYQIYQIKDNTL